jgi:hypothetical protein
MCYSSPPLLCLSIQIPDLYNFQIDDHFTGMISATDRRERWRLAEIRSVFFRGLCSSHRHTDVDPPSIFGARPFIAQLNNPE